ncbi:MAG: hypothetical protein PVG79_18195 [Gemmatimonadales bacterium]|jgi:hypothetical protein
MDAISNARLWLFSGLAGLLAVVCYVLIITLSWPETQLARSTALLLISAWPVLSIVYSYGLYNYIAAERDGAANRLAFVFGVAAFTTVLAMVIVQLTVGAGVGEFTQELDEVTARAVRRGLRLIDLGLDVAWDMLVGVALVFLGVAMRRRSGLGLGWAIASAVLGVALIGLNAASFPWPPADGGLFDIGPLIGLFMFSLAGRLALLGWRAGKAT